MFDSIIIGSGPAGLTAAIYISQAGYKAAVIVGSEIGGNIAKTSHLINYPGLIGPITGQQLIDNLMQQCYNSNVEFLFGNALEFNKINNVFNIKTDFDSYSAKTLILATGSSPRILNLPYESNFFGKGIHTCATCDGAFYKNKDVAVIGGGNSAAEYAFYLSNIANKVYILYRKNKLKVSNSTYTNLISKSNIEILYNTEIAEYYNESSLSKIKLNNGNNLSIQGIFYALGHVPNTNIIQTIYQDKICNQLCLYDQELIDNNGIEGLFVAGDCTKINYQQAITAAADGAIAGMKVNNLLQIIK
jgi:thioredoxin reductase (NADPH)